MRIQLRRSSAHGRWAGPSRRAVTAAFAGAALALAGLVTGLTAPTASAATCGTTNIALHHVTSQANAAAPAMLAAPISASFVPIHRRRVMLCVHASR